MRLLRAQHCLIALIFISFLACMIITIGFTSDTDIFALLFGESKEEKDSTRQLEGLLPDRLKTDVVISNSTLKSGNRNRFFNASQIRRFVNGRHMANKSASFPSSANKPVRANDAFGSDSEAGPPEINYNIHLFYYPWYGSPEVNGRYLHWNHRYLPHWKPEVSARFPTGRHQPPDDIGATFYPRLGPYSSSDPQVIEDHMQQIQRTGAGVLSVSWYPPNLADDEGYNVDELLPLLLDIADKYSLKVCLHIEPYANRNAATLYSNIEYIVAQYGNHSAFFRWPGTNRPVYYIYDSYKVPDDEWKSLLTVDGKNTVRGTVLDGIFLGLVVERSHPEQLIKCGFDGIYTYFATDGFTFGSTYRHWAAISHIARRNRALFVPSVGPGYDDLRIRPWNGENVRDRQHGQYYERSFAAAVAVEPHAISVTSFNEWHEGTQIEEAVPKKTDNFTYADYSPEGSDYYLLLTQKWAKQFSASSPTDFSRK